MARVTLAGAWPIALAALPAVLLPLLLLQTATRSTASSDVPAPLALPPAPLPLAAAYQRPVFAAAAAEEAPEVADAPALLGVVGRLMHDAVAMVRTAEGTTRTLAPGESVDGWRLESLAADAAYFTRGNQRARVPMPGE